MHFRSVTAVNQAGLLLGRDRVTRLDRADGSEPIAMDDWTSAKDQLPYEGCEIMKAHAASGVSRSPSPTPKHRKGLAVSTARRGNTAARCR